MTSTTQAVVDLHEAAMRAKYLADEAGDSRLFHLRQISAYTGRLVEGVPPNPAPVFHSVRAIHGSRA
ncbi:hypothetical protein [Roseicitreum antarcticum]|uniref:hypothetical protein n=1 Tax=Roseicitreum antarcticum TaxID=564137 RepID=UPI00168002AD|nr:hypothetical protein [Roseicitreum antarcticum]